MLTAEQIELRKTGVGSSDIGAVAGLSPYASPLDVWLQKRGLATVEENEAMRWGTAMEPVIASTYERAHLADGEHLFTPDCIWPDSVQGTLQHPEEPWILASPDRVVMHYDDRLHGAKRRLVEIKTVSHRSAHHWGDAHDDVPPWYRAQIEWQMLVTGVTTCDLAALIGGAELRVYRLTHDPELAAMLVAIGRTFWRHVEAGTEPPVDGSPAWRAYLEARFPRERGAMLRATPAAEEIAARLADARARKSAAEADEELAANELRAVIGEAAGVEGEGWRATWKAPKSGAPKWKDIATELGAEGRPELVARHTAPPTRRFTFTEKK